VNIELHHHLLHNRRNAVQRQFDPPLQWLGFRARWWAMESPVRYWFAGKLARFLLPFVRPWTATRELPALPAQSFKDWWRRHGSRA